MIIGQVADIQYGKPAKYSYFVGGSTGGRQGLSEAQRFPKILVEHKDKTGKLTRSASYSYFIKS